MGYDLLFSFLYLLIFCCFMFTYHHIKKDLFYMMVLFFGIFCVVILASNLQSYYTVVFLIYLVFSFLFSFWLLNYEITVNVLGTLFLGLLFIVSSNVIVLLVSQFLTHISFVLLYNVTNLNRLLKLLSVILSAIITINYVYFIKKEKVNFVSIKLTSLVFVELSMLLAIFTLIYFPFKREDFYVDLTLLFLILAFIGILKLYYQIQVLEQQQLNMLIEMQKDHDTKVTYNKIHKIREEIADMEHALTVTLLDIKNRSNDYDISILVDNYIQNLSKYSSLIATDNPFFDVAITTKLNELMQAGRFCKIGIFISCDLFYDNLIFVSLMCDILTVLDKISIYNTDIDLSMMEKNQFTVIKFVTKNQSPPIVCEFTDVNVKVAQLKGKCRIEMNDDVTILMSFNRNDRLESF